MKNKINLFEPNIDKSEEKIVLDILRSKFWASGSGVENVKKFEIKFKKYIQSYQCLSVNSGTAPGTVRVEVSGDCDEDGDYEINANAVPVIIASGAPY